MRVSNILSCILVLVLSVVEASASSALHTNGRIGVLRLRGGRKGVTAKHTASELQQKAALANTNRGGGKAGMVDRAGGAAGHAKFVCPICNIHNVSMKNMQDHHESKHPKLPFDPDACVNAQEIHGGSTKGIAVPGTQKKAKQRAKEEKTAST